MAALSIRLTFALLMPAEYENMALSTAHGTTCESARLVVWLMIHLMDAALELT